MKPLSERFPNRATSWKLRTQTLRFDHVPKIMGIINVTPDSFSDGGKFSDHARAVNQGLKLAADGADILDIGGASTRPNADAVDEPEEIRRVVKVVSELASQTDVPISIDTSKANVAKEAIAAGAEIINDVTGLEGDSRMPEVALSSKAGICAMHMRGTPKTMLNAENLAYNDVVKDVMQYLQARFDQLAYLGIEKSRICLDPGIGFAKSHQQNLTLLAQIGTYHQLGTPILVGHSKKGFLAKVLNDAKADRTYATVGVSLSLAAMGIQVVRVHDVASVREALLSFAATGGIHGSELQLE